VQIVEQKGAFFYSFGWLLFLFLLSGCAALIYQVVWQRTLFAVFGVNIESVTVIVSVFMFGLGIGALLGGQLSERFVGRLPYLFMVCELMIGLFGLVSLWLIHGVGEATQGLGLVAVFLTIFALLCVPTILMGATLPILVAFLFAHFRQVGRTVGLLYFANTLGSAIACFLTVDVLFAFLGQQASVWVAAGFNLVVGTLVLVFARGVESDAVLGGHQ
jgi:MFS family permease